MPLPDGRPSILSIATMLVMLVPLVLVAYCYYYLALSYAQQQAVAAAVIHTRILDIKPQH